MKIREYLKLHPKALRIVAVIYNILHRNNLRRYARWNTVVCQGAFFDHSYIRINGRGCKVIVEPMARLRNCVINICGNNCSFKLGGVHTIVSNTSFVIEDDGGSIIIGKDFTMEGGEIAATEGESISIGEDCMLSGDVEIRNGDSHVILDKATGQRTNYARPITIGNHVWLTAHVRVLKGAIIPDNCIVGNSSVASHKFDTPSAIYAGNPAKLVKTGITWNRFRNNFRLDSNISF